MVSFWVVFGLGFELCWVSGWLLGSLGCLGLFGCFGFDCGWLGSGLCEVCLALFGLGFDLCWVSGWLGQVSWLVSGFFGCFGFDVVRVL